MAKRNKLEKVYYYSDLENDDFGNVELDSYVLEDDYEYLPKGFNKVFSCLFYWGIVFPILGMLLYFKRQKIVNKKNIKKYYKLCKEMNCGGFIYCNHVSNSDPFFVQTTIIKRKRVRVIGNSNSLSNKLISFLVRTLGMLPLSNDLKQQKKLLEALEEVVKVRKEHVIIFPEAHEWPFYTKIRPLRKGAFHYPVKFNTPVLPIVTTFKKPIFKWNNPRRVIIIGEPIVAPATLDHLQKKSYLCENVYQQMVEMSQSVEQFEKIKYVYREKEKAD